MKIEFIEHSDCDELTLLEISRLKNESWQYPIDEHLSWICRNLHPNDTHLLVREENCKIVGYLNLIKFENYIGIGNVCVSVSHRHKKNGFLLIKLAEYYCYKENLIGILLCKNELKTFYKSCNWLEYNGIIKNALNEKVDCNLFSTQKMEQVEFKLERLF